MIVSDSTSSKLMRTTELSYRQASRYTGALVYAFPLDIDALYCCGDNISPISPGSTGKENEKARNAQIDKVFNHVVGRCDPLWPGKVEIQCGYSKGKHYILLALVAATRRNEQIIPQGETLQKLKDIMVEEGFKGVPRWFVFT